MSQRESETERQRDTNREREREERGDGGEVAEEYYLVWRTEQL